MLSSASFLLSSPVLHSIHTLAEIPSPRSPVDQLQIPGHAVPSTSCKEAWGKGGRNCSGCAQRCSPSTEKGVPAPLCWQKWKMHRKRCSSTPTRPALGLSLVQTITQCHLELRGAEGHRARRVFLPPFCSSRALVSGEQFPSLTRYSWNSLKPMDWKMPCW